MSHTFWGLFEALLSCCKIIFSDFLFGEVTDINVSGLYLLRLQICRLGLDLNPNLCKHQKTLQAPEVPILELAYGVYTSVL